MKHLTILTHAPQGTLGDPKLCAALAEDLQKRHPGLKIKIVVAHVEKAGHWRSIDTFVKENDNTEIQYLPDHIRHLSSEQKEEIFGNTDGIIVYPTFHFFNGDERKLIEETRKDIPVIFITQYNFQLQQKYDKDNEKYIETHPSNKLVTYEELLDNNVIIETGIGKRENGEKLVGVNLSDTELDKQVYLDGKDKAALNDSDAKSMQGILGVGKGELSNEALAQYKSKTDLYFGYYNNLPMEAKSNWANASSFVKLAVMDSLQKNEEKKNIDIVIPLKDSEDSQKSGNNFDNVTKKLDLTKVTAEYWEKDPSTGELVKTRSAGNGPTTVRLISAFPFAKSSMDLMHRMSDPLTLMTGNSSLSEAIEYDKIPLYQIMSWHTRLDQDLLDAISSDPPFHEDHAYRIFQEVIRSNEFDKEEKLAELLKEHRNEILEGAKYFHTYVNQNYNLKENLPKEIDRKFQQQKNEIEQNATKKNKENKIELPEQFAEFAEELQSDFTAFKENGTLNPEQKNDLFLLAFMQGDLVSARKLLQQGADPNFTKEIDGIKYNPLYFCINHHVDEKLLKILSDSKDFDPIQGMNIIRESMIALENSDTFVLDPVDLGSYKVPDIGGEEGETSLAADLNLSAYTIPKTGEKEIVSSPVVVDGINLTSYTIPNTGESESSNGPAEMDGMKLTSYTIPGQATQPQSEVAKSEVTYVNPYETMQERLPKHHIIQMLIDSAIKMGKDPKELFKEDEIYEFVKPRSVSKNQEYIYGDIFIKANLIPIKSREFRTLRDFYEESYEYKFSEKENWQAALTKYYSTPGLGLRVLNAGLTKHADDVEFLRDILLNEYIVGHTLLKDIISLYPDNTLLKATMDKILSVEERAKYKTEEVKDEMAILASEYSVPSLEKAPTTQIDMPKNDAQEVKTNELTPVVQEHQTAPQLASNVKLKDIDIYDLMQKLDQVALYNESAEKVLYGEGALLSMSGYQYIRKLQLEAAQSGKPLKNVYFSPEEHPRLNVPVFIGEEGEPICFYKNQSIDGGNFGQIYLGLRVDTGEACIVKKQVVDKASLETQTLIDTKSHIEKYHFSEGDKESQFEAQKRIVGSNLKNIIQDKNDNRVTLPEDVKISMSSHVAKAVSEFHAQGKIHRDLSLQNIMIESKSGNAILVDFGLTVNMDQTGQHTDKNSVGMVLYRSPENLSKKGEYVYNEQSEVYALGVILALINSNQTTAIIKSIEDRVNKEFKKDPSKIPQALKEAMPEIFSKNEINPNSTQAQLNTLIQAMTDPEPNNRPKMTEVVALLDKLEQGKKFEAQNTEVKKSLNAAVEILSNSIGQHVREGGQRKSMTFSFAAQNRQTEGFGKTQAQHFVDTLKQLSSKEAVSAQDVSTLMKDIDGIQNQDVKKQVMDSLSNAGLSPQRLHQLSTQTPDTGKDVKQRSVAG